MIATLGFGQIGMVPERIWAPAREIQCAAWLDFGDPATLTIASGEIDAVASKASTRGIKAQAHSSGHRPAVSAAALNGRDVALFSSDGMYLSNAGYGPINATDIFRNVGGAFIAAMYRSNPSNPDTNARWVFFGNTNTTTNTRFGLLQSLSAANTPEAGGRRLDADSGQFINAGSNLGTAWTIVVAHADYTNSDLYLYVDGTLAASTTSFQTAGNTSDTAGGTSPYIGSAINGGSLTQQFSGDLAQLIIGRGELTTALRQKIEGYLAHVGGLTANLPGGHPYKSVPP